jgi:hypothetical protein
MTDKEYLEQKKRVQTYFDKWFNTLGLGWHQVDINWSRVTNEEDADTAARTTWQWQYRSASITFFLPTMADLNDDKLEAVVVHEFAHILTGPMVQNTSEEHNQLMEYGTESVARALIWAGEAGVKDKVKEA